MNGIFPIERCHRDQLRAMGGFWFLSSPYTLAPDHEEACKQACAATGALIKKGARVFSPIAHSHTVALHGGVDPLDVKLWLDQNAPLLRAAHGLIVLKLPGWRNSKGVEAEIKYMRDLNKPIMSMEPT